MMDTSRSSTNYARKNRKAEKRANTVECRKSQTINEDATSFTHRGKDKACEECCCVPHRSTSTQRISFCSRTFRAKH